MITLVPAYNRDYKSKKEVQADWDAGKDFIIQSFGHRYDGKPANKSDLAQETGEVFIRYKKLTQIQRFKTR